MVPGDRLRRPWVALCLLALAAGCATQRVDPGEDDAATVEDQGVPKKEDVGEAPPEDAGLPPEDTGNEPVDTGNEPADTGNEPLDSGNGPVDTGVGPVDTGNGPVDTGVVPPQDSAVCPTGFSNCAGQCRALSLDPANCGACGRACATGQQCLLGVCLCPSSTTLCSGACVDTRTDAANCGACGRACATGQQCMSGMCRVVCAAGQTLCGSTCVNTQTDAANCGACGTTCLNGAVCTTGRCTGGNVGGTMFQVVSLNTTGCRVADHNVTTGDDRGAIAVSDTQVFYTGDTATGRFDPDTLMGSSVGASYDAMFSNLRSGQLFTLAVGSQPLTSSGGRVDGILELNRTSGARTTTRLALSPPITIPSFFSSTSPLGFFSGWDRLVILAGGRGYNVNLTNGGVTDLGAVSLPTTAQTCEVGALWGVAEFFNNAVHVAFVQRASVGAAVVARMRLPDGMITPLAQFTNLSDMCAFSVSPARRRWYFHHEGMSQFGGTSETVGYCDAVMAGTSLPCPTGLSLCGSFCRNTQNDPQNCGGCGMGCPSDRTCSAGTCVAPCPTGQGLCGGVCTDLQSNNANCGACGRTCISGQFCAAGNCIGGPRYTRSNSMEPFVQACSTAGNTRVLSSQDDGTTTFAAPFPLRFWGSLLTAPRVTVSTNGWISPTHADTGIAYLTGTIPSSSSPNGVIAAQWRDLETGPSGICVVTTGTSPNRRWIFQWANARYYADTGSSLDFEIVLHETTGVIDLLYSTMTGAQSSTVGIENSTGTIGLGGCEDGTTTCTTPSNTRIRFTPSP